MTRAHVKPELIRWVREDAGLSLEEAARKAGVRPEQVAMWERGEALPTVRQLRLLGRAARRPLAVFYLPSPPQGFQAMRDFRRLPGVGAGEWSTALRLAVRAAVERREIAVELAEGLEEPVPAFRGAADPAEPPEVVAGRLRELLGVPMEQQRGWADGYAAFNAWRSAVEELGVLVFQAPGIDLQEMRGFSLAEVPMPAIVLNVRDTPQGRIFTLVHEFCHLLIRQGGVCDLEDAGVRAPEEDRIEVFCNAVAAEALVPRDALRASETVVSHERGDPVWGDGELTTLAQEFSVSREVILRRLLTLGLTTAAFYQGTRKRFLEEYAGRPSPSGPVPVHRKALSQAGTPFARLVLVSYYQERITARDVSEYLGVKLRHMPGIEERVMGGRVMFR